MELVIQTFGTLICRDNEGFVISNSNGRKRICPEGISSIQIGKGTQITSDAIMLAVEREIEILFIDRSGNCSARVWSPRYGSISTIRKGQLEFVRSAGAVEWIKAVLTKKIINQQALLQNFNIQSKADRYLIDKAVSRLEEYLQKILQLQGEKVAEVASSLRGYEGYASKIYFSTLNAFLPSHLRFENRTQHPAMDVVNAMLNYGYGILYGKVESCLIKAGIDPYIGVLHRDEYNRPVMVYDVIEIYRVWVDYVVYSLSIQNVVTDEFYSRKDDGSCWLETFGRKVLIQSLNDYFEEVVTSEGVSRSRLSHISLFTQKLAQTLKKYY